MANEQTGLERIANYLDKMERQINTKLRDETTDKDDRISLKGALVVVQAIKEITEFEVGAERRRNG
jgi:hypothetical protein